MQYRWTASILTVAAAFFLFRPFSPVLWAQKTPDLSGVWTQQPGRLSRRFSAEDAPLQPSLREIYKANRGGQTDANSNGVDGEDPEMYCLQAGVPRVYTSPFPIEIVQTAGRVFMVFHSQTSPSPRYIYIDGQDHPEGYPTTFMGHSVGKWEGDTLVVDTIDIDGDTWLDGIGTPHSDELHVVERIRRVAQDTLEIEFRFEDPKAYTKPWGGKKVFKLTPDVEYLPGLICDDRFKTDFAKKSLRDKKDWIEFKK